MSPESWISLLQQQRAIAVIRAPDPTIGVQMAHSVAAAGMTLIEITWNSDRASDLVTQLRKDLPTCVIGVGTVVTSSQLKQAIAAGAEFAFSPHTNLDLIQTAQTHHVPMIPGALSPTEIVTAWQAGAASVKVFPVKSVGGADYIRCLQGPLSHIPLIPTGGVTLHNAERFLNAGAIAVGLSGHLFPKRVVAAGNWDLITQRTQALLNKLAKRTVPGYAESFGQ